MENIGADISWFSAKHVRVGIMLECKRKPFSTLPPISRIEQRHRAQSEEDATKLSVVKGVVTLRCEMKFDSGGYD